MTLAVEDLNSILDDNAEADDVADVADEGNNHNLNSNWWICREEWLAEGTDFEVKIWSRF